MDNNYPESVVRKQKEVLFKMYKFIVAALRFIVEPIPLLWRTVRHPLSVHQWIGKLETLAVLGLMVWVGIIASYAAGLLQPNFDLYMFGERGAGLDHFSTFSVNAPFAKELVRSLILIFSLLPLLPMTWLYHGSFKKAFFDERVPLLYLLFGVLGTLISALIKVPLGLELNNYPDDFLAEHLVADVYAIIAGTVAYAVTVPIYVTNLYRLFPAISKLRFMAGLGLFLLAWIAYLMLLMWIFFSVFGDTLADLFSSIPRRDN